MSTMRSVGSDNTPIAPSFHRRFAHLQGLGNLFGAEAVLQVHRCFSETFIASVSPPTEQPLRFCKQTRNQLLTSQIVLKRIATQAFSDPVKRSSSLVSPSSIAERFGKTKVWNFGPTPRNPIRDPLTNRKSSTQIVQIGKPNERFDRRRFSVFIKSN